MPPYHLAVDTGGTFSDFVLFDVGDRSVRVFKVPSTPRDPAVAMFTGLERVRAWGVALADIAFFSHGTTVATNALLEERGARTALVVTEGLSGVMEVGEQTRPYGSGTYDLAFRRAAPLAPAELVVEVDERVDASGKAIKALDLEGARRRIAKLADAGVEAVAVCLLFGYLNGAHERELRPLLEDLLPGCPVSLASETLPEIREYYRMSTTVVNAYCSPSVGSYLQRVSEGLEQRGFVTQQRYVMQSNGGVTTFEDAALRPVTTLLSGPAGGVTAGMAVGRVAGFADVITFDMGGTSCDVAVVAGGLPASAARSKIAGRDVAVPMIDMVTVGAGGGTIASVDDIVGLKVGPRSAGAEPGPVAYGRGGEDPTVTDANLVLGYLDPAGLSGRELPLDLAAARAALESRVADPLGLGVHEAAAGIVRVVTSRMVEAVKSLAAGKGIDLRDFSLVAFGGAGPLHATSVAEELGLPQVIVPPYPGVNSALGLLMSDVRHDYVQSRLGRLAELTPAQVLEVVEELCSRASSQLAEEGFTEDAVTLQPALDLRYAGQGYELSVAVARGIEHLDLPAVAQRFHDLHLRNFGHSAPDSVVEVVSYRLVAWAAIPKVSVSEAPVRGTRGKPEPQSHRRCYFAGLPVDTPVYERRDLFPGDALAGPAVVEQADSTFVVRPRQRAEVDAYANILVATAGVAQ